MNFARPKTLAATDVLRDKRGIVEALGATVIVLAFMIGAGGVIVNYAIHSKQAGETLSVREAIANRAESYAASLNANLTGTVVPATDRECTTAPALCTQIISVTTDPADATKQILRIQGDTVQTLGMTLTQDVVLKSTQVTHVTSIDADGNNVWALSNEGLRYTTWGVASGKASDVSADELGGPSVDNTWVSVDDRAGIDSRGALWVWGKNTIGQAGVGSASADPVKPKMVSDASTHFRSVITGDDRGYAIDSTGRIWAWGQNDQGQLGLPADAPSVVMTPTKVPSLRVTKVAIAEDAVVALTTDGHVVTAGAQLASYPSNTAGQWQVLNGATTYTDVAASTDGGIAMIDDKGSLTADGGAGTFQPNTGVTFSSVSFGQRVGYAISTDGFLYSWGAGQALAQGSTTSNYTPTGTSFAGVTGMPPRIVSLEGGKTSALAIDTAGQLYYVGQSPSGYVGGTDLPTVTSWTKLLPSIQFRQINDNSGDSAAALLDTDGNLYGLGTATPGLWPMSYHGADNQPIRMPVPDGFSSYTWK